MKKQYGIGNGHMELALRGKKHYVVFGGPFREIPTNKNLVGVKMAAEIRHPHDIDIPTPDFQTPALAVLEAGLLAAVTAMTQGKALYVGCMAGRGRTGLFLSILAKTMGIENPVEYVREHYYSHAVETDGQYKFVMNYEIPASVVKKLKWARFKSHFTFKQCLTNLPDAVK